MSDLVHDVSDDNFDEQVRQAGKPVLVDFWAMWCNPCRALLPTLEDVAESYGDDLKVVKVDVERNARTAEEFGARGIPLLVLLVDGEERGRVAGALTKTRLCAFIDSHI